MLSVVFSSFNGERTLNTMLDACCSLAAPPGGWEIIAADNASTDRTGEIMRSYAGRLPIRVLHVPAKGKNNALNAALEVVQGELVVLTDDDVVPEPNWLCTLAECAAQHPDYDLFGGSILPRWPHEPEEWVRSHLPLGMVFAVTDPKLQSGDIEHTRIWGPNMAVRRRVFQSGLRFNGAVGPDGTTRYAMGSETEFTSRLKQLGYKAWFCAGARVEHIIREHQLDRSWILNRFYRIGRSDYLLEYQPDAKRHLILGVDRWILKKLVTALAQGVVFRASGNSSRALNAFSEYHRARGSMFQARLMNRAR